MAKIFQYNIDDDFAHSVISLKGSKRYYVEGYASTITRDKAGEIIAYSAQEDLYAQLKGENITLDIEHAEWYDENGKVLPRPKNTGIPVAKVVDAELREQGVWIKAELNQNLSKFSEVWGSIKDGFLKAFSIAFYPVEKAGEGIIKRLNLVNITLTGSPVNPQATFSATMKSASAYLHSSSPHSPNQTETNTPTPLSSESIIKGDKMTEEEKKKAPEEEEEDKKKKESESKTEEKKEDKKEGEAEPEKPKMKSEQDYEAEIKALTEKYEAEIKALKDAATTKEEEAAKLKAELEKPVMKAMVSEVPKPKEIKAVNPLGLIM